MWLHAIKQLRSDTINGDNVHLCVYRSHTGQCRSGGNAQEDDASLHAHATGLSSMHRLSEASFFLCT